MSRKSLICAVGVGLLAVGAWKVYACSSPPPPPDPEALIYGENPADPIYTCTDYIISFGGSGVPRPGGRIIDYKWEFPAGAYDVRMSDGCIADPEDCYCTGCGDNCLDGQLCLGVQCKFSSTGAHTVKLTVTDDLDHKGTCECTVYVANVTSVVWVTYPDDVVATPVDHGANIDIDTDPHPDAPPGDAKRIFPGKKVYDDTAEEAAMRHKVKVKVTVSNVFPGMPVYLDIWDVDDPSADDVGLPESQCTSPLDCDELTHTNFHGWFHDNRCDYVYYRFEGGLPYKTEFVQAGSNQVEAIIPAVSPHPGDNVRVTATTGLFLVTWEMVNSGTGLPDGVKRSPILTTWRKLHLELDSMASGLDNPVSGKNIDDTWNNTPHTGESGAEINGWNIHPDEGQYEGGPLTVSTANFEIIDNKDDVGDDTVYVIGNICPYEDQSASFTDDDVCPLPRKVDWSLMNSKFNPAYVQAVEEDGVYDPDATFIVNVGNSEDNANDAGLPVRDRTTSEGYWMVQVLSCHQGVRPSDFDPDVWYHWHSDSNYKWGDTDPALHGQSPIGGLAKGYNISNVFLETIRDYAAYTAWFKSTHPPFPTPFTASQIEQTTVVHEVGRIFGCDTDDGGIMQHGAEDPALNFTLVSLDKIRKAAHIGTP